jgi:hypothetical protein
VQYTGLARPTLKILIWAKSHSAEHKEIREAQAPSGLMDRTRILDPEQCQDHAAKFLFSRTIL